MEEQANYIKRIEIHRLWDRFDIAWDLRPDVNILSGIRPLSGRTFGGDKERRDRGRTCYLRPSGCHVYSLRRNS